MSSLLENTSGGDTGGVNHADGREVEQRAGRNGAGTRIVRYGAMGWVGEFACKPNLTLGWGTRVVVQTDRGIELGECVGPSCGSVVLGPSPEQIQCYVRNSGMEFCKPRAGRILRLASEQDVNEHRHLNAHVREDIDRCAGLAEKLGLDIKIVTAEHLLGGERIVFYFRAPGRVDFRRLVKELAQHYRTRIEMRQVGARDEARLVGDYEICGRECCCRNFLKKLRPVNMKMAKLQKSTLDPTKVSGRCGRLRCCLRYEHMGYEELAARLPRTGSRVATALGTGTVIDRQILTQLVAIRTDDERILTVRLDEITAFDVPAPPQPPAGAGAADSTGAATPSPAGRSTERRLTRIAPARQQPAPAQMAQPAEVPVVEAEPESRFRPETPEEPGGLDRPPLPATSDAPSESPAPEGAVPRSRRRRRRRRRRPRPEGEPPADNTGRTPPAEPP